MESAVGTEQVMAGGLEQLPGRTVVHELHAVAELAQQQQFEAAQQRLEIPGRRDPGQQPGVGIEHGAMGIVLQQQAHQQLVHVQRRVEALARDRGRGRDGLDRGQRLQVGASGPGHQQRLEGLAGRPGAAPRAARATGDDADAAEVARQQLEQQAGLAPGAPVQHEGGLPVDTRTRGAHRDTPATISLRPGTRGSSARVRRRTSRSSP